MLAEYGTLPLATVLAPAIELADGYPIDAETADLIEASRSQLEQWPYSRATMLPHHGSKRAAPEAGEIFRQPDLAATLRKLVEAEAAALKQGKSRQEAIRAAHDRFYRGDLAEEVSSRARTWPTGVLASRSPSSRTIAGSTSTSSTSGRRAPRCCSP
jgi:gamma-glutamyltranspeptidase/glutathione hydrolase